MKKILSILLLTFLCGITPAQITAPRNINETELDALRDDFQKLSQDKDYDKAMEKAVQISTALLHQKRYKEAASLYYQMDLLTLDKEKETGNANYQLRFIVTSQRLRMFSREGKPESSKSQYNKLMQYWREFKDEKFKDDLLLSEAEYYRAFDMHTRSMERYKELLQRCLAKSDEDSRENCYQDMLAYAEHNKIDPLIRTVRAQYSSWQDSIKVVRAARELETLKQQKQTLQEDLQTKEEIISTNKLVTTGLWTLIVILIAGLLALLFFLFKNIYNTRKYKNSLKIANESNVQKSHFISNINTQITPSLDLLEDAISHSSSTATLQENITSLRKRIDYMQRYISLEESREESYPVDNVDIKLLCENIMINAKADFQTGIEAVVTVPRVSVKTNAEALEQILLYLLARAANYTESGKISLEFKKRNARTGQFIITDTGVIMDSEKLENIFKPFAETDPNNAEDWILPICQLMAYKLNGSLKIDPEYKKGTRFILDLCS